jgi:linoleoyl-CoA desaturase
MGSLGPNQIPNVSECSLKTRPIRFREDGDAEFRAVLQARVRAYLAQKGGGQVADWTIWAKGAAYAVSAIACYAMLMIEGAHTRFALALAVGYGLSVLLLAIALSHDAAHGALTGRRALDGAIHRLIFTFVGIDGYLWQMRHLGSHHVFPNVNGSDLDIDENPFLRLSPNHPWKPKHRGQHIHAPFVYCLALAHSFFVGDFAYLMKDSLANMRGIRHKPRDVALFFLCKLAYLVINFAVPMLVFACWQVLIGYAVMSAVMSLAFIFLLVGTHFSDEAEFPVPDADGRLATGWATHVLKTSVDWLPESRLALLISGGANAHAAHHLFPRLSHAHAPAVTRIVRDTAKAFGVAHHETDFLGVVRLHFRHLRRLGHADQAADWDVQSAR